MKRNNLTAVICCLTLVIASGSALSYAQTQQTALSAIQQAENKLFETVYLLEESSASNIDVRDLVTSTDYARQLIADAKVEYNQTNYIEAYDKSIEAIDELNSVENELESRKQQNQQNNVILFSLVGVFSAVLVVAFIFFFNKRIYPWYIKKRNEEYGKLEIKYEETGGTRDD